MQNEGTTELESYFVSQGNGTLVLMPLVIIWLISPSD